MKKDMRKLIVLLACLMLMGTAFAAVTTEYLGNDQQVWGQTIQGSWPGKVGADGYHLLYWGANEDQKSYPAYLGVAQNSGLGVHQWFAPGSTTDARAVINAAGTQRAASIWWSGGTAYIRSTFSAKKTFILGVYMLGWDLDRTAGVAVCARDQEASPPWEHLTTSTRNGYWIFVKVSGAAGDEISIRIRNTADNPCVAMLSFDPAETAVSEFVVTDATSDSTIYTDDATVNVSLVGEPLDPAKINGYMITTTSAKPEATDGGWAQPADPDNPVCPITEWILSGEGMNTLYGWVRDDAGAVAGKSAAILFNPNAVAVVAGDAGVTITSTSPGTADVEWASDSEALGRVRYRVAGSADAYSVTDWTDAGTDHAVTMTGLTMATDYEVVIQNNDSLHAMASDFAHDWTGPATMTWDGNGDPNNSGNWSDGLNWAFGAVPRPADDVVIGAVTSGNRVITVDTAAVCNTLAWDQASSSFGNEIHLLADLTVGALTATGVYDKLLMRIDPGTSYTTGGRNDIRMRVAGSGSIVKNGAHTWDTGYPVLLPFTGTWVINNGVLASTVYSRTADSAMIVVNTGGTFQYVRHNDQQYQKRTHAQAYTLNGEGFDGQGAMRFTGMWNETVFEATNLSPVTLAADSDIAVDTGYTGILAGAIDGAGGLRKIGDGTLVISGSPNTYGGITDVAAGTLTIQTPITSTVVVRNGATLVGAPLYFPGGVAGVTVEPGGTWEYGPNIWTGNGDPNNSGNWSDGLNWAFGAAPGPADDVVIGAVTSGDRVITVDTAAVCNTLAWDQASSGFGNEIHLLADLTVGALTATGVYDELLMRIDPGTSYTTGGGNDVRMRVAGSGSIVKNGPDTWDTRYPALLTFTGTWVINNGVLASTVYSRTADSAMIVVNTGGTFQYVRNNDPQYQKLTHAQAYTLNGEGFEGQGAMRFSGIWNDPVNEATNLSPVTLATDSDIAVDTGYTGTLAGAVDGDGILTKIGAGKLAINGTCTAPGIVVAEGAFGGTGTVSDLTMAPGSTLAPGGSIGTLTAGSATLSGAIDVPDGNDIPSTISVEIINPAPEAEQGWDYFDAGASLTINATPDLPITVSLTTLLDDGGTVAPGLLAGFDNTQNYVWRIIRSDAITGFVPGAFVVDSTGFLNDTGTKNFSVKQIGDEIAVVFGTPLDGDANMDCKVNILDLIFVRNRLNQSVETGDNWQANVNGDDKINILDLIYVRNRLNTTCDD